MQELNFYTFIENFAAFPTGRSINTVCDGRGKKTLQTLWKCCYTTVLCWTNVFCEIQEHFTDILVIFIVSQ